METKKNWHTMHQEQVPFGQKLAQTVVKNVATSRFVLIQSVIVLIWVVINIIKKVPHWDDYPYALLGLIFAMQAALLAPFILIAQDKQVERDEALADAAFKTAVESKMEIEEMMLRVNEIQTETFKKMFGLLEEIKAAQSGKVE